MGASQSNSESNPEHLPDHGGRAGTGSVCSGQDLQDSHHRVQDGHKKKNKAKPCGPGRPNVTGVTHNAVTISWLPPRNVGGHRVIAYTVEILRVGEGGGGAGEVEKRSWRVLTKSCQSTSYQARQLEANSDYVFKVRAENIYGVGKPSLPSSPITTSMYDLTTDSTVGGGSSGGGSVLHDDYHNNNSNHSPQQHHYHSYNNYQQRHLQHGGTVTSPPFRRRQSFNLHLEGGVTSILNHSDIIVSAAEPKNPSTSSSSSSSTSSSSSSTSSSSSSSPTLAGSTTTTTATTTAPTSMSHSLTNPGNERLEKSQTLSRSSFQRNSLQSGRKVSLPILLPGTGTNSLNRLIESRNSLRTSYSDYPVIDRNRSRESRCSFSSSVSDVTTSASSGETTNKKVGGSRSSLRSSTSDVTVPNTRDGRSSSGDGCVSGDAMDIITSNNNNKRHSNNSIDESDNINNVDIIIVKNNDPFSDDSNDEIPNDSVGNNNNKDSSSSNEIDVWRLKEDMKTFELTEERLKHHELQEGQLHPQEAHVQRNYYAGLEDPWERDLSIEGVARSVKAAPSCEVSATAGRGQSLVGGLSGVGYAYPASIYGSEGEKEEEGGDFRTLRSVLQSSNMIVKTSRSVPDVVGLVMGEGGEARTLTRNRLTTIVDADEEEDTVRVTTL